MGICEGRVAIVTGAGGGLGRAYARRLAVEGAYVVVNDINAATAASCVAEIEEAGGRALLDTHDITDYGQAGEIVKAAVETFGDLHAVVNNAGNNRDRMFTSLTPDDWDAVMTVHLKGHFCLSSHAAKRWRAQSKDGHKVSGRIINTSSGAGLQGSVAQANYSAAKGGILSLTLVQAAELGRYGITANALAPQGRTGMTAGVFDEMMKPPEDGSFDVYDPANVAPLVAWLVSERSSHVNGRCFECYGGKISVADGWRTGEVRDKGARWEPDEIGLVIDSLIATAPPPQPVYGS
jgi:NAD(P)-dependent dehydrogenase (short-subunit alcohol dehydrogenase family)